MNSKFYLMRIRTYAQQMANGEVGLDILDIWADHMSADWSIINIECDELTAELLDLSVLILQYADYNNDYSKITVSCKKIMEMCRDLMTIA